MGTLKAPSGAAGRSAARAAVILLASAIVVQASSPPETAHGRTEGRMASVAGPSLLRRMEVRSEEGENLTARLRRHKIKTKGRRSPDP